MSKKTRRRFDVQLKAKVRWRRYAARRTHITIRALGR
jgi:hypothetical protein